MGFCYGENHPLHLRKKLVGEGTVVNQLLWLPSLAGVGEFVRQAGYKRETC
jgi:hypothetical protein